MEYKVFISHSTRDRGLVISLARLLQEFGVKVIVADWYLTPGEPLDKKVFGQIDGSDCVVVLLTQNGIRSNWVQHEIGYALAEKKPLIPIVEKGVAEKDLGSLKGREYIEYDIDKSEEALIKTSTYVKSLKIKKKEEQWKVLLVAGGILAFLLLLSGGKK